MLRMSQRDRDRLLVLRQVAAGELTVTAAAERAGVSRRQFHRWLVRYRAEGDRAVIHRARGQPPNNRKPEALKARVLERAREPVFHDFGPTLLAEHLSRDPAIGPLHPSTLRRWLIEAGQWEVRPRRLRHRRWRERRRARGELVQMDTSIHPWLEERSGEEIVLIAMIDDATSRLFARFVPRDTGRANRQMVVDYLRRWGRMGALYVDRASHFQTPKGRRTAEDRAAEQTRSVIRRGLEALKVEMITAHSPQAKGRVERGFGTLQDRLLKELRVRGVASREAANRYLEEEFLSFWEERFTVPPADPTDAHRPLPEGADLERLFATTESRVIGRDFTIRYHNVRYQISKAEAQPTMPGQRLVVEQRLDDTLHFRWRDRYLSVVVAERRTVPSTNGKRNGKPSASSKQRTPWKPPADHPWRKPFPVSKKALRERSWEKPTTRS